MRASVRCSFSFIRGAFIFQKTNMPQKIILCRKLLCKKLCSTIAGETAYLCSALLSQPDGINEFGRLLLDRLLDIVTFQKTCDVQFSAVESSLQYFFFFIFEAAKVYFYHGWNEYDSFLLFRFKVSLYSFSGPYQTFSFGRLANFPDSNRCEIYTKYWNWIEI